MPTVVDIPSVGEVEFPDGMSDQDISKTIETEIIPQHTQRKAKLDAEKSVIEREQSHADILLGAAKTTENVLQAIRLSNPVYIARSLAHLGLRAAGVPGFEHPLQSPDQGVQIPKPTGDSALAGAGRFASDLASFATSPEGVGFAASGAAPLIAKSALQAGLATTMISAIPETASALGTAVESGTAADVTEESLKLGMESAIAGGIPASGLRKAITPKIEERVRQILVPRSTPEQLPIKLDAETTVPPLQDTKTSRVMATTPGALGNIPGLAYLLDPRSINRGEVFDAVLQRQYEQEIGKAVQTVLGRQIEGKYEKIFGVDESGRITGVKIPEGDSPYIADFFESLQRDPSRYRLTEEQQSAFEEINSILDDAKTFSKHHKLRTMFDEEGNPLRTLEKDNPYFPRQRIFTEAEREEMAKPTRTGQSIGAKQTSEKTRLFDTEAEGRRNDVTYEPTIYKRLVHYVGQLYRIASDERLADEIKPMGETFEQRKARYAQNPDLTESEIDILASSPRPHEGNINQPAFVGRIYPAEVSNVINEFYGGEKSQLRKKMADLNQGIKGLAFGFDFGGPLLQGQALLMANPKVWAKSVGRGFAAFADKEYLTRMMESPDNLQAARELSQLGVPFGRLSEFMPNAESPGLLKQMHLTGAWERFQSFQNTFLESGIMELWKAQRETVEPTELARFAETLQNVMMTGRMEGTGMSQNRILLERALLLAPAYLRGSASLVAGIAQRGESGAMARRAMASWTLGGLLLFYGLAKQSGMSDSEIEERLNPDNADFATVRANLGGREINVGFGGSLRSIMRLAGDITGALLTDPSKLTALGVDDNPILRWLRGKLAPFPSTVTDAMVGRDFLGNDIEGKDLFKRQLPLAMQPFLTNPGEQIPPAGEILPGSLGLFIFPEAKGRQFERKRNELALEKYSKPYESLPFADQLRITDSVKKMAPFNTKEPLPARLEEIAREKALQRIKDIEKSLGPERMKRLGELEVMLTGYNPTIRAEGVTVPMTRSQQTQFSSIVKEEFAHAVDRFLEDKDIKKQPPMQRQEVLQKVLTKARDIAKARYIGKQGE